MLLTSAPRIAASAPARPPRIGPEVARPGAEGLARRLHRPDPPRMASILTSPRRWQLADQGDHCASTHARWYGSSGPTGRPRPATQTSSRAPAGHGGLRWRRRRGRGRRPGRAGPGPRRDREVRPRPGRPGQPSPPRRRARRRPCGSAGELGGVGLAGVLAEDRGRRGRGRTSSPRTGSPPRVGRSGRRRSIHCGRNRRRSGRLQRSLEELDVAALDGARRDLRARRRGSWRWGSLANAGRA